MEILNGLKQIHSLLRFHVIFTMRRLLLELGGIQSSVALPGDTIFSQTNNRYDKPSWERLRNDFGLDENVDFRYTDGVSNGLGEIYLWYSTGPDVFRSGVTYPNDSLEFSDLGGSGDAGTLITYIKNKIDNPFFTFCSKRWIGTD